MMRVALFLASAVVLLVPSCGQLAGQPGQQTLTIGGLQFTQDDFENQEKISNWATQAFYSQIRFDPAAWGEVFADLVQLAQAAAQFPALSLGVGMALYSYFWWEDASSTRVNVPAAREAAAQFQRSIQYNGCDLPEMPLQEFFMRQCHVRWRYLLMIAAEVGRYVAVNLFDPVQASGLLRVTTQYTELLRRLPFFGRYEALGAPLAKPHDTNFNQDHFPQLWQGPVWSKESVPLAQFLENHFQDFRADLQNMMDDRTFWELHFQNQNAETQFGPRDDDWQTVYLVRNRQWSEQNCRYARRACELLQSRPEIADCSLGGAGAGFLRLRPGARLKPHYGNAPRMSAHLGLIVPEEGEIQMTVGGQEVRWETGKSMVFDDTFVHSVVHDGVEPRFILNVWFCHPCDTDHNQGAAARLPSYCPQATSR